MVNALEPPRGVDFGEWTDALTNIISIAYLLLQGARNVPKETLRKRANNTARRPHLSTRTTFCKPR